MSKKSYTVGISCIGSGIGQAVLDSLQMSQLPIKTVGLGTNPFAFGAYNCDAYAYTLSIYDTGYVDNLIEICRSYQIDLVIPGLDDEVMVFAQNAEKFDAAGIKTINVDSEFISLCRDKERMCAQLNSQLGIFVKSYNKATLAEDIESGKVKFPLIAKPRGGSASKGIEILICNNDLLKIREQHIVQELAIPRKDDINYDYFMSQIALNINPQVAEISIELVYSPEGKLLGRMASYNKLKNGVPIEAVPFHNKSIWHTIDKLTPELLKLGMKGSINIQGRLTDNGFKIFEINPRFTGLSALRALMGFNEVEVCVKEWLGIDKGKNFLHFNPNRFGVRQTAEKSIALEREQKVFAISKRLNGRVLKAKKTVLVTGACGYLGQNLIRELLKQDRFDIWAFDIDKNRIKSLFADRVKTILDNSDLKWGRVQLANVDLLLHLGFTRPHGTNQQIAESLQFTGELFKTAVANQIPAVVNISSQSVYGSENQLAWKETTPVAPATIYAQAKYATELLLNSSQKKESHLQHTSLRLGTLAGGAAGLTEVGFLSKIARAAYEKRPINVEGGVQNMERFDVRDAVAAIITLIDSNPEKWKPVYNLGSGRAYKLLELVEKTVEIAAAFNGGEKSEISIEKREVGQNCSLDCSLFTTDFKWHPKYNIEQTIESYMRYFSYELYE